MRDDTLRRIKVELDGRWSVRAKDVSSAFTGDVQVQSDRGVSSPQPRALSSMPKPAELSLTRRERVSPRPATPKLIVVVGAREEQLISFGGQRPETPRPRYRPTSWLVPQLA